MKVTVSRDYLAALSSPCLDVTFSVDMREFQEWKFRRYGNAEVFPLNNIDPVGEALHLLREFYLSQRQGNWRERGLMDIVEAIVEVCDTSKLLPPNETNG
jgi:hypothetical protein